MNLLTITVILTLIVVPVLFAIAFIGEEIKRAVPEDGGNENGD